MDPRVRNILDDPTATLYGKSPDADALVADGAVDEIAEVLRAGWESNAHPIDVIEALQHVLARIAVHNQDRVRQLLADASLSGNVCVVRAALEWARLAQSGVLGPRT